jgi:hypothetical protein
VILTCILRILAESMLRYCPPSTESESRVVVLAFPSPSSDIGKVVVGAGVSSLESIHFSRIPCAAFYCNRRRRRRTKIKASINSKHMTKTPPHDKYECRRYAVRRTEHQWQVLALASPTADTANRRSCHAVRGGSKKPSQFDRRTRFASRFAKRPPPALFLLCRGPQEK